MSTDAARNGAVYRSAHFKEHRAPILNQMLRAFPAATVIATDKGDKLPYAVVSPLITHLTRLPLDTDVQAKGAERLYAEERPADALPTVLYGHFARENPHWRRCVDAGDVLLVFRGPDAYISPNWYPEKRGNGGKVVPTWNYASVHVRGKFRLLSPAEEQARGLTPRTHQLLTALTDEHERTMPTPWKVDDAPKAYLNAMARQIVCFAIDVTHVVGSFKVSQNKSEATAERVAVGLAVRGQRTLEAAHGDAAQQLAGANMKASADLVRQCRGTHSKL